MLTSTKDFSGQNLRGRSFKGQDLHGAKFIGADIRGTNFRGANLDGANFAHARGGLKVKVALFYILISSVVASIWGFMQSFFATYTFSLKEYLEIRPLTLLFYSILMVVIYSVMLRKGAIAGLRVALLFSGIVTAVAIVVGVASIMINVYIVENVVMAVFSAGIASTIVAAFMIAFASVCVFASAAAGIRVILVIGMFASAGAVLGYDFTFLIAHEFPSSYVIIDYFGFIQTVILTVFIVPLAWRAIKGDRRQVLLVRSAVTLIRWGVTNFRGAYLTDTNFGNALLKNCDFRDAILNRANWRGAKELLLARTQDTILAEYSVQVLLDSSLVTEKSLARKNLKGADLVNYDLTAVDFTEADLSEADLRGAKLTNANLTKVHAIGTLFEGADLTGACIEDWNIDHKTKFNGVTCRYIYLLNEKRERRPQIGEFSENQFSQLFEKVFYTTNLILGMKGIDHLQTYFNEALKYDSCFISYSQKDEDFAKRLYQDLKDNNVRCWFAPVNFKIGDKIRPTIDEKILNHDKVLIILSENSVKSDWVEHEIETALDKEVQQGCPVLFPIRIDESVMNASIGWAAKIRKERHIGDFREWRNLPNYEEAFQRLLRDLLTRA